MNRELSENEINLIAHRIRELMKGDHPQSTVVSETSPDNHVDEIDKVDLLKITRMYKVRNHGVEYRVVAEDGNTNEDIKWRVFAARGSWAERECDPSKPTYKRIVSVVQATLQG